MVQGHYITSRADSRTLHGSCGTRFRGVKDVRIEKAVMELARRFQRAVKARRYMAGSVSLQGGPDWPLCESAKLEAQVAIRAPNVGHARTVGHNTGDSCRREMEPDQEKS